MIDRMLRPDPADRQTSNQELIAELQAAHAATLAREEEEPAHWSWAGSPDGVVRHARLLVALGFGAAYGWRHLFKLSTATRPVSGASATPAGVVSDGRLQTARRELEAGHYPTAEALFRELAVTQPNGRPAAELCAGLQLWERGQFAQAATILHGFAKVEAAAQLAWLRKFTPLAQDRLHDYQVCSEWENARSAIQDPAVALRRIRKVEQKLKAKDALAFQLADEEAKVAARVSDLTEKQAAAEKALAAEDAPRLKNAVTTAQKLIFDPPI